MQTSTVLRPLRLPSGRVVPRLVPVPLRWPPGCPPHQASGARALLPKYRGSRWPSRQGALEQSKDFVAIRWSFHREGKPSSFSLHRDEQLHTPIERIFLSGEEISQRLPPRRFPQRNSELRSSTG